MKRKAVLVLGFVAILAIAVFAAMYIPVVASGEDHATGLAGDSQFNMTAEASFTGYSILQHAVITTNLLYVDGQPVSGLHISVSIFGHAVSIANANVSISVAVVAGGKTIEVASMDGALDLESANMFSASRDLSNHTLYWTLKAGGLEYNTEYSFTLTITATIRALGAETGRIYTLQLSAEPISGTLKLIYESIAVNDTDGSNADDVGSDIGDDVDIGDDTGGATGGATIGTMSTLQGLGMLALVGLGFVLAAVYYNPKYRKRVKKAVKRLVG